MTPKEWLAIGSVLAALLGMVWAIRLASSCFTLSPEASRKSVHVALGIACCTFPWIFTRPLPVWVLASFATIPVLSLRLVPFLKKEFGKVLHGVARPSYGEVLFAPAVATVFQLSGGNHILHLIPILILTLADAAAALAGSHWGKRIYSSGGGFKSVEGSGGFLLVAFACILIPLLSLGGMSLAPAFWISLILATIAMMAEGFSDRGFDNIILPVGCYFLLARFMELETSSLVTRFIVLALLLALVLTGSRWSSLSGASLLGAALLGYGSAVLADWRYALPTSAIFICHLFTTHKRHLKDVLVHHLDAVISHAIAAMPWVIAAAMEIISLDLGLIGLSLAMSSQLAQIDHATRTDLDGKPLPAYSLLKGLLFAGLPGLLWFANTPAHLLIPVAASVVLTIPALLLYTPMHRRLGDNSHLFLWYIRGTISLTASLPTLLTLP